MPEAACEPGSGAICKGQIVTQALTFVLAEQTYAVDILRVKEIRGWSPVTRLPEAPSHVLGVLNLRGANIPILDLRARLCLERVEPTPLTVIIVLWVRIEGNAQECGFVVDGVSEVLDVPASLLPSPELGDGYRNEVVRGLIQHTGSLVTLLEVDRLIAR